MCIGLYIKQKEDQTIRECIQKVDKKWVKTIIDKLSVQTKDKVIVVQQESKMALLVFKSLFQDDDRENIEYVIRESQLKKQQDYES